MNFVLFFWVNLFFAFLITNYRMNLWIVCVRVRARHINTEQLWQVSEVFTIKKRENIENKTVPLNVQLSVYFSNFDFCSLFFFFWTSGWLKLLSRQYEHWALGMKISQHVVLCTLFIARLTIIDRLLLSKLWLTVGSDKSGNNKEKIEAITLILGSSGRSSVESYQVLPTERLTII